MKNYSKTLKKLGNFSESFIPTIEIGEELCMARNKQQQELCIQIIIGMGRVMYHIKALSVII